MKTEVDQNRYQSIHFDKLSCRQVSFSDPKGTPSREEHKCFTKIIYTVFCDIFNTGFFHY
jgi:hypothetical protein